MIKETFKHILEKALPFIKNSFYVSLSQIVVLICGFIITILFARYTSKTLYGQYNLLMAINGIVVVFSMPGISNVIYRAITAKKDGTYLIAINFSLKFGIIGSFTLLIISLYYFAINSNDIACTLILFALVFPFYYPFTLWKNLLNAKEKFFLSSVYFAFFTIITTTSLSLAIYLFSENLIIISASFFVSTIIINFYLFKRSKHFISNNDVESTWKSSSYKLMIPVILSQFYSYIDKITLSFFFDNELLAIYAIAIIPAEKLKVIINSVLLVIFPKIYKSDTSEILSFIKNKMIYITIIIIVVILVIAFILPKLIIFLYTEKYNASILPAQYYLLIIPFYILTSITGHILLKEKKESYYTKTVLVSSLLNIVVYITIIPLTGIIGGIIGSLVYLIVQSIMRLVYILKNY